MAISKYFLRMPLLVALGLGICSLPTVANAQEEPVTGKATTKGSATTRGSAKARAGGTRSTGPAIGGNKVGGKEKLTPAGDPEIPMDRRPKGPVGRGGDAPEGMGLEGNVAVSRNLVNGRRILQVSTDNKSVLITDKPSGAVSLLVTTYQPDDTEEVKHYTATSPEELAAKHPEAARLYQMCKLAAKPKPEESLLGGIDGTEVDVDAAMRKAREKLEKMRGSEELDDGGRAILDQVLKGLGG